MVWMSARRTMHNPQSSSSSLPLSELKAHPFGGPFLVAQCLTSNPPPTLKVSHPSVNAYCSPFLVKLTMKTEHYFKGGFKNILRCRDLLFLSNSWPAKGDREMLVGASTCHFAYPAAVLRFVDRHPLLEFQETLRFVLDTITSHGKLPLGPPSPFAELDAFHMLIVTRLPQDILPSIQLLFAYMFKGEGDVDASYE
ncbi:hypothetical protein AN958_11237 [Leucoagaricus sp. SymC.cos]|nr:hypothetical protein AN958_11237 [Leucoagaricus sp. SymC.cos]